MNTRSANGSARANHWELEFPDVFNAGRAGFDAILGNPSWDIAKPSSKEFFSNVDPLYRSYGKQEALEYQGQYFATEETESDHGTGDLRRLEDWESAEALATPYSREQVDRFSPRSKTILEIQSRRDLEILEAIQNGTSYLGSLVDFFQQFDMTGDSSLFPPVSTWQREGFEPDHDRHGLT